MRYNVTIQGKVIVDELRKVVTHPTADEIFAMVRPRLPKISKGTVYRNLDKLTKQGEILMLQTAGQQRRYDGNPIPHFHMRCSGCGAVSDIEVPKAQTLSRYLARLTRKLNVDDCSLEFHGQCGGCKGSKKSSTQPKKPRRSGNDYQRNRNGKKPVEGIRGRITGA